MYQFLILNSMKKLIFIFAIGVLSSMSFNLKAQENTSGQSRRVYAELLGRATNLLGLNSNCIVDLDMGQFQSVFKFYTIQDDNGKDVKFHSMVDAMNYMGERGWKFVQAYVISHGKQLVYHWLMYKDIVDDSELFEGINLKNMKK